MPKLNVSTDQVFDLIKQLPERGKMKILKDIILEENDRFFDSLKIGEEKFKAFCKKKGIDPEKLSEDKKEDLIDTILHEDG